MKELARTQIDAATSVQIDHNGGLLSPCVRVMSGGLYRPDLIQCVVPTPGNERNSCTVHLSEATTGTVQVLEDPQVAGAPLPPEEMAGVRESAQFGAALFAAELTSRLQESATDWTTVLALEESVDLQAGTYAISWSFAWQYSHNNRYLHSRVVLLEAESDPVVLVSYAQKSCGDKCPTHGETFRQLTEGTYNMQLQLKASHHRDWFRIDERSLRIWRAR
jgi:hypothetical protein